MLKAHHRKAYRKRHLSALAVALVFVAVICLQLGVIIGRDQTGRAPVVNTTVAPQGSLTVIHSTYGYSLSVDSNIFTVAGTDVDGKGVAHTLSAAAVTSKGDATSVTLKPQRGTVSALDSATQLVIQVNPDTTALSKAQALPANAGLPASQVAAQLFPVTSNSDFDISTASAKGDTINGVPVYKTVYQYTPTSFSGGTTYSIVWTGTSHGRAFAIKLQGLVGSSAIPAEYSTLLSSLYIDADQGVQGAMTDAIFPKASADTTAATLDPKYLSDALSPAVVKVYHIICGVLTVQGQTMGDNACTGMSGSGFLATSNGYIATNGHVAVYSAKDAFVDYITSDPSVMTQFLAGAGLSDDQIQQVLSDQTALASIIGKIYALPDDAISFTNKQDLVFVSLGDTPPKLDALASGSTDLSAFQKDTADTKVATVVGSNYDSADNYAAVADPSKGFSHSDVALLKINVTNAPTIAISGSQVTQNEKIFLLGFPGEADNELTSNDQLDVSVTDGVVSSIRKAAGNKYTIYQSDVASAHGNSGGPAIGQDGTVIGLLTYGYSDGTTDNSRVSYIRNIADFTALAGSKGVTLNSQSATQQTWQQGLNLYSKNHFSAAIKDFHKVKAAYAPDRLVDSYIASAQAAIKAGKDVKDFPVAILIVGLVVGLAAAGVAIWLIVRHRAHHQLYQAYQPAMPAGVPPATGFVVNQSAYPPQSGQPPVGQPQVLPVQPVAGAATQPAQILPSQSPQPAPIVITPTAPATAPAPAAQPAAEPPTAQQ